MTPEEIIEMANQAGCVSYSPPPLRAVAGASMTFAQLEALIKLVAAKEREACAKVCDAGLPIATSLSALDDMEMWGEKFAAAIRARGGEA